MSRFMHGPWSFVPWHVAEGPSEVRSQEGWLVCTTSSDDMARLIAAAPDLLEALFIARDYAAYAQAEPEDMALIDAAIAKATPAAPKEPQS